MSVETTMNQQLRDPVFATRTSGIDAVITWVDGSDPTHQAMRLKAIGTKEYVSVKHVPSGRSDARYTDNNEIEYCVNGIRKYMPWIRHIFLVTAQQTPAFLDNHAKNKLSVSVVDHSVVFEGYEWALPTFNSRSIETVVHRIPGLADRYIYFNDDFIPVSHSDPSDFFDDGKVVVRGKWDRIKHFGPMTTMGAAAVLQILGKVSKRERSAHLLAQMRAAQLAGFKDEYFRCDHAPHPVYTNTLKDFFSSNEEALIENIRHRFRSLDQFVTHPLAHHLEAARGNFAVQGAFDHLTLDFSKQEAIDNLKLIDAPELKFLCLQSLQLASDEVREAVVGFLSGR